MAVTVALFPSQGLRFLHEEASADLVSGFQSSNGNTDLLHSLLALAVDKGLPQLIQFGLRFSLLCGRQEHLGFDQHQMGCHGYEFAGDLHIHPLHLFQIGKILLQNSCNGHILYFNFIFAQKQENNIQRAFKILHTLIAGTDNAFQMILWFSHFNSSFSFTHNLVTL